MCAIYLSAVFSLSHFTVACIYVSVCMYCDVLYLFVLRRVAILIYYYVYIVCLSVCVLIE